MKTLIIAEGIVATGTVAQTAVGATATPFLAGRDTVCRVVPTGLTGTPTVKVQGSDDNATWTDLVTHTVLYEKQYNIKCARYVRANQTVAGSAGTYSVYLDNGV